MTSDSAYITSFKRFSACLVALAVGTALGGCVDFGREVLTTRPAQPNPTGPAEVIEDVAVWSNADSDIHALYLAAGSSGVDVNRADGSHLQRLGSTPASRAVMLTDVPVDAVPADLLVTVDPDGGTLRGFEVHPASGGLRRIARSRMEPLADVVGLCSSRAADGGHRMVVTTGAPAIEEWAVSAESGKIRGRANEIVATRLRHAALKAPATDCVVDETTGVVLVLDTAGSIGRIDLGWTGPIVPEPLPGLSSIPLSGIALVALEARPSAVLATTVDGRLLAFTTTGERLGEARLDVAGGALSAAGGILAMVADSRKEVRLASLDLAMQRLGLTGAKAR